MTALLLAFGFLTTLSVRLSTAPTAKQNAQAVLFYPVVGLGLMMMLACFIWGAFGLNVPVVLTSSLVVAAWVRLTGALHLDGLADSADGLAAAHKDKDKILAIMKDPNCGAMGVVAIVLCLLVKFASVYALLTVATAWQWVFVLMLALVLSRMMILVLFLTMPLASKQGMATAIGEHLPRRAVGAVLVFWVVALLALGFWWQMLLLTVGVLAVFSVFAWWYRRRWLEVLGGVTGDVIGGAVELCEMLVLVSAVAILAS